MALDSGTRAGKNGRHEEAERKTRKKILSSWSFHGGRVNSGISLPRVRNRNEKKKSREREREIERRGERRANETMHGKLPYYMIDLREIGEKPCASMSRYRLPINYRYIYVATVSSIGKKIFISQY